MKAKIVYHCGDEYDDDVEPIMGGDSSNPTWEEYLDGYIEEYRPHIAAIRECIEENNLIGVTADKICNDIYFECEDGKKLSFSWRAWGDLMQAIVGKREGYMKYYMGY